MFAVVAVLATTGCSKQGDAAAGAKSEAVADTSKTSPAQPAATVQDKPKGETAAPEVHGSDATDRDVTACMADDRDACLRVLEAAEKAGDERKQLGATAKLCDLGNGAACFNLGVTFAKGEGGPKDLQRAVTAFVKACEHNHAKSCTQAGLMLFDGEGVPADAEAGTTLLERACGLGEPQEVCNLAKTRRAIIREQAQIAGLKGKLAGAPSGAGQGSAGAVASKFEGIEWVVQPELAPNFRLRTVKCDEPFRDKRMCHLTIELPEGWSPQHNGMAVAKMLDAEGVQTGQMHVSPVSADPGQVVRERLRIEVATRRVVIGN